MRDEQSTDELIEFDDKDARLALQERIIIRLWRDNQRLRRRLRQKEEILQARRQPKAPRRCARHAADALFG